jgi:hypothetical protein
MLGAVPILKICWCKQGFQKSGTIDSVRQEIKYIMASERRLKVFSEIAKGLDLGCKKLILDVSTR